ncbi:hypothetical protein N866_20185 [Actinotalea ferrariae CF5-4]|uniref:DUF305 domain-containing protein n=1 Tax=Actinotalea ferrariae CF5-4 TaxID=948458 RepID=A0A021VQL6_9CELL|nr:DUF305 domain-containing protein [Actinotalea ferrariae]EYR63494.1 hypothetical protein N866_20185 [Actinotalea ferrariae CF5-4]
MTARRRLAAASGALSLTLLLGACGGTSGTDAPAATSASEQAATFGEADTVFAQMMVVHHEGALEMAGYAAAEAETEEVRALAERIEAAQGPEIDLMTGWLGQWGEEMPDEADMGGMDHGGMDMEGMSQEEAMEELRGLSGTDVDRRFLELMIEHHRGAVEMAEEQLAEGENPEAVELAGRIIEDQQAEIAEMEGLLADL